MMGRLIPCEGGAEKCILLQTAEVVLLSGMAALQGGHAKGVMF
jgi:hypothetical protein